MKKTITWVIVAVIVAGGAGFFVGKSMVAPATSSTAGRGAFTGGTGGGRSAFAGGAGGLVAGSIISVDSQGITVALAGNASSTAGSRVVLVPGSAHILKSVEGSLSDLTTGEQVTVMGTSNTDGSITATTIQVRNTNPSQTTTSPAQ